MANTNNNSSRYLEQHRIPRYIASYEAPYALCALPRRWHLAVWPATRRSSSTCSRTQQGCAESMLGRAEDLGQFRCCGAMLVGGAWQVQCQARLGRLQKKGWKINCAGIRLIMTNRQRTNSIEKPLKALGSEAMALRTTSAL